MMDPIAYHNYQYHGIPYPYRRSVMPGTILALRNESLPPLDFPFSFGQETMYKDIYTPIDKV